jgi:2-methylcitrate dehydratase PrpD
VLDRVAGRARRCPKELIVETKPTENLAGFAAELGYDDLPGSARQYARLLLVDSIACALASDYGQETGMYTRFARIAGGPGDATVIGSTESLSLLGASLLNGYLITAATVCDSYVPAHVHITPEVVPPIMAIAERDRLDGKALLAAIAIGAEVAVRVADGIDYTVAGPRGWHMPGIVGPFGAAAAVGNLRGLTSLQMRNALALAGSQSAGTWASWGTPTVKFHQSRGAVSGLLAGLLAEQGFTGSAEILAHRDGGIFAAYSNGGDPSAATAGLGERYAFEQISLRLWPGGTPLQPTLTAVFELLAAHRPAFDAIERVRIEVAPDVYEAHARFAEPEGTFDALLSYPFTVGSALRDRRFWLDSIGATKIGDPDLRRFMRDRVALVANPALTREHSRVEVTVEGETLGAMADGAKGAPANPATPAEVGAKFDQAAAGRMAGSDAAELLDLLFRIDEVEDLSRLFGLLRSARERTLG